MPPRTIALPTATALVIANMVGTGVFTSLGFQVPALPAVLPILTLWIVGGLVSLCGALCYAEVVAMRPRSGGEYHLLREAYHPLAGFLAGWVSLVAGFAAPTALAAMAFGKYMVRLGCPYHETLVATVVIVFIVLVHLAHLGVVEKVLGGLTLLKVGLILTFIAGALLIVRAPSGPEPGLVPRLADMKMVFSGSFAQALVSVMYAYTGWNGAAYIASEVRDPQRNVPRALILGTVTVILLYVGLNAAFLYRAPWPELSGKVEVALVAATSIFGERGGWWMGGLIAFGLVSMIAGLTWAGSRVNQRVGQDFPGLALLAKTNAQGAPHIAVLLQATLALVMLHTGTFDQVLNYVEALLLVCSMLAVGAVIWLRIRDPHAKRPFRTPLYPLPPLVFIATSVWMLYEMAHQRATESLWGLVTIAVGVAVYAACRKKGG